MKTYYAQLRKPVLGFVQHYKEDFTIADKKLLRGYDGTFILAMRETGTDICLFDNVRDFGKIRLDNIKTWMFTYNKRYFIGSGGIVKEVLKQEALDVFDRFQYECYIKNGE